MIGSRASLPADRRRARRREGASRAFCHVIALALVFTGGLACASDPNEPTVQDQQRLVRMVRQDCGSCHGSLLTGGLGPALTPAALREWPEESLTATILNGRPGTPMPPWKTFVSEDEAGWIARQLRAGFPQEPEHRK